MKHLLLILSFLLLSACGNSNDRFAGYYKYESMFDSSTKIAEIKREGDAYFFSQDSLNGSDFYKLNLIDGKLHFKNTPIDLSDDNSTLLIRSIQAQRVSDDFFKRAMNKKIALQKECAELQVKFDRESKQTNLSWNSYVKQFQKSIPKGCKIAGANMRW